MYQVKKRNGDICLFDLNKVKQAMKKTFESCNRNYQDSIIDMLSLKAIANAETKIKDSVLNVEDIQDSVESTLMAAGYEDVAKAYILYRKQHERNRNAKNTVLDYKKTVDSYLKADDWRVKENASIDYSLGGLILGNSGSITANYWLSEIYDDEISNAHRNCDIHIHDLSMLSGYCFTGDTVVKSLDGKNRTFEQLVNDGVKELWVYSYDTENKKVVPAKAENPRVTRVVDEIVEIMLASGKKIKCTKDHPIMLRDGSYLEAEKLKPNMSVMPLNIGENGRYVSINKHWTDSGRKQYVHRWVMESVLCRPIEKDEVVHHINEDKHDNRPENLQVMDDSEHRAHEISKTMQTDLWKNNNHDRLVSFNKSDEKRKSMSDLSKNRDRDSSGRFITFSYNSKSDPNKEFYNHRVRKVTIVKLEKNIPVYDLTVPVYNNFAVGGNIFVHNCSGWSLKTLIKEGFGGVPKKVSSKPAKHLSTLCQQMVNFLGTMSLEWSGAQAFNSVDTLLSPFVREDNLSYLEVKQCIQSLVFGLNTPSRWGCQPVFSNFTFDWTVPSDLAELNVVVGGVELDFKYKDCKREMDMINKAFLEVMIEGDADGRSHSYPIPTYSITKDFDWDEDSPNNKLLFEMTAKYGIPYFSNYINSDMSPQDVRSMCPLHKNERVLVRDKLSREFHISEIGNLYNSSNSDYTYDIILNGRIKQARVHKFTGLDFYRVTTVNGYSVVLSGNHMNLVLGNKIKQTHELTESDYLPFNIDTLSGAGLSFDDGFVVGAFLGDGSFRDDNTVTFSLNDTTKAETLAKIIDISVTKFGARVNTCQCKSGIGNNGCINLSVTSKYMRGLIDEYVTGHATDKKLNVKAITRSEEFRQGIIDGYMATDGGNKNRIYTASVNAVESVTTLFESLGIPCRISVDNRDSNKTLSDNLIYTIRPYDMRYNKSQYKDVFIKRDGYMWFKIKSIERIDSGDSVGYCFEVLDDDEPYFMLPSGLVTHNCRLRLSLRELRKKNGGYFGSGDNTGSIGVVTINMPRLAYKSNSKEEFYKSLENLMNIAARSLKIKRNVIEQHFKNGLYPYTKRYLKSLDDHFSTIGLLGMNECCLNAKWVKDNISSKEGKSFTVEVLDFMREKLSDYQEMYGDLYNLEATPGEGTTYRFAMHDKKDYPDIITAGDLTDGAPYYTNSSHLPVGYTDDIFEALDHQDELQIKYTSGTVFHAFLGEKLPNWKSAMMLTKKIAENYRLPYFTFSPTYSICKNHGYLVGEQWKCPHCGEPTEVYSRVTGYYRAVQNFNDGKAHEFKDRKEYKITEDSLKSNITARENDTVNTPQETQVYELDKPVLITTETCPNCKIVKEYIKEFDFDCDVIVANEHLDFVRSLNINQAPTLVVPDGDGNIRLIANASNIRKYLEENS